MLKGCHSKKKYNWGRWQWQYHFFSTRWTVMLYKIKFSVDELLEEESYWLTGTVTSSIFWLWYLLYARPVSTAFWFISYTSVFSSCFPIFQCYAKYFSPLGYRCGWSFLWLCSDENHMSFCIVSLVKNTPKKLTFSMENVSVFIHDSIHYFIVSLIYCISWTSETVIY